MTNQIFHRHVVVDEEREELAKNVADNQEQAEHENSEEQIHEQLATYGPVDQFHCTKISTDR